jgi:hypothetical protein
MAFCEVCGMKHKTFPPLRVGQRIRVSRATLEDGVPAKLARLIWTASEGVITALSAKDNDLAVSFRMPSGEVDSVYLRVCWFGPKLSEYGKEIEILEQPAEQGSLFVSRRAIA